MRMWRTMFSISTIASSTSTPATRLSASSDRKLSVIPIMFMNQKAGIADSGMASAEISGRADVAQEQEDDEHGEDRAFDQGLHRRVILRLGVVDLVEDLGEVDPRIFLLDLAQLLPGRVVGGDVRRALGALDVEADDLAAVHLGDRALLGIGVLDLAEVGQLDRPAAGDDDLGLRQLDRRRAALPSTRTDCSEPAISARPPAALRLVWRSCGVDLRGGDALRLERGRIEDRRGSRGRRRRRG